MAAFIIYIIRWAVVLTLFYSLYGLTLRRETLHSVNRVVLLVILAASMALPLVQVETQESNIITHGREVIERSLASASVEAESPYAPEFNNGGSLQTQKPSHWRRNEVLLLIYLMGLLIAWLRYLWSLGSLLLLIRRGRRIKVEGLPKGVTVLVHPAVKTPCSWMHWILLSPSDAALIQPLSPSEGAGKGLLLHELSHIRLGHSWDMLLCELTCRMLWCVPFAWMLRQNLRDVHEYQADRSVLLSGIDENEYQLLLIRKATTSGLQPVVNALNQSPIKRRFQMMYKKPSRRWVALKAAYLVPLSALALVAFARPQTMSEIERQVEETAPALTEAVKALTQQLSVQNETPASGSATQQQETEAPETPVQASHEARPAEQTELPDSNLVKADLRESGHTATVQTKSVTELLDSTMQAVGARKIADGTFIGHFQPSLNNDTVRIAQVSVRDLQSQPTGEHLFAQNAASPFAYNIILSAETRKGKSGYYIRYLQPASSAQLHYDRKHIDPMVLSTDSVLTKRSSSDLRHFTPIAIQQDKEKTRIFMYIWFGKHTDVKILQEQKTNIFKDLALVDEKTGDKYICHSTDYAYFKLMDSGNRTDSARIYQTCLIFPPLGKRVKRFYLSSLSTDNDQSIIYNLSDIPRKGRIITN